MYDSAEAYLTWKNTEIYRKRETDLKENIERRTA